MHGRINDIIVVIYRVSHVAYTCCDKFWDYEDNLNTFTLRFGKKAFKKGTFRIIIFEKRENIHFREFICSEKCYSLTFFFFVKLNILNILFACRKVVNCEHNEFLLWYFFVSR